MTIRGEGNEMDRLLDCPSVASTQGSLKRVEA